jgi:signal transduction histidine kinase/ActR/RegA family two-component response regulator
MGNLDGSAGFNMDYLRLIPACAGLIRFEHDSWHPVFIHQSLCELLGETEDEFIRELVSPAPGFLHPENADSFSLLFYKAGISGGLFQTTDRVRTAGGKYRWMEISLNVELQISGEILLCILFNDVNIRMERQQKLDRVYSQLLDVMNNTPGGIVAFDTINNRKLIPVFVSQGMNKLLRGTEEELSSAYKHNPYDCIHPDDRGRVIHAVEDALRNLSGFQVNVRLRTVHGEYVQVSATATVDAQENQRMMYMAVLDISTDAEDAHIQKQVLNLFIRRQYENICLIDGKRGGYRVLTEKQMNNPFLSEKGENFEGDMAAMIRRYAPPEEQEPLISHIRIRSILDALKEKEDLEYFCTMEAPGQKRQYKRIWLSWLDRETKTIAMVSSDVTEDHRRAEENRDALISALRAAEQANGAKSEFLSRMSHDIRTPLNAIIGYIEMSMERSECPDIRNYLSKAEASSRFLLSLINDILNMSRIESGKLVLEEAPFGLSAFLDSISAVVSSQCAAKQIRYSCSIEAGTDRVYVGDQLKIQQVLLNLVGNAVKFTPAGGKISLDIRSVTSSNPVLLRFCVKDTGCGISPHFLPHLFEPFAQEKRALDSEIKGTGLGLAICKSLVEMMGGSVSVQSEQGIGSAFIVTLPLRISDEETVNAERVPESGMKGVYDFAGSRILLAEDNAMNTEIARHVLEKVNFQVDAAVNGEEACRMFADSAEGTYQAVLMDIRMPVMDGLAATRTIRAMDRRDRNIPVIAMSANAFEEDAREAMSSGMNAYTIKPIDVQQLYETLRRFIP